MYNLEIVRSFLCTVFNKIPTEGEPRITFCGFTSTHGAPWRSATVRNEIIYLLRMNLIERTREGWYGSFGASNQFHFTAEGVKVCKKIKAGSSNG